MRCFIEYDFVVVGAGIVGLTVALELARRDPGRRVALLEKEPRLGRHASGRNSGVLHAGIYYGSDTLKAKVCSAGSRAMQAYAIERGIRMERTGKVIVAPAEEALERIDALEARAKANGVRVERISREDLPRLEPNARSAGDTLYSPDTAIIDAKAVLEELEKDLEASGVELMLCTRVKGVMPQRKEVDTNAGPIRYGHLVNCAGAHADRIAHLFGVGDKYAVVPFKGTYFKLSDRKKGWVRGNIYPAPDLRYPFLGVHLTRVIDGGIYVGPSAIPALGRENYGLIDGVSPGEVPLILGRLARMYLRNEQNFRGHVHSEVAKYGRGRFFREMQAIASGIGEEDLLPCDKVGIRPQLVDVEKWRLVTDFVIEPGPSSTHVLNAISPAFTASFEFARLVADRAED